MKRIDRETAPQDPKLRAALAAAESTCRANGLQLTPIRRRAIEAMVRKRAPMKAYELAEALNSSGGRTYPTTAYRTLEFLEGAGLVRRVAAMNAYALTLTHAPAAPTSFFICDHCNVVRDWPAALAGPAAPDGFHVTRSIIEYYGTCAGCAARDGQS